jgi:hypothetical protein
VARAVSKRRLQSPDDGEPEADSPARTPEERRAQRKRDRRRKEAQGKGTVLKSGSRGRRAAIIGLPAAAIVIAVVVLVFFNPFRAPCLTFSTIPSQSGLPAYPNHTATTDLTTSWCPPGVSVAEDIQPYLQIEIQHQYVGLPDSIGRNSSYTYQNEPYNCDLPINTQPASPPSMPDGTINIVSPWPYAYTLGDFFEVWSQSYSGVDVNTTDPNQPITYTSTDLLGFSADASHQITLFVDNQVSHSGPGLELNTLPYVSAAYPSCVNTLYGSGHTILLTYTSTPSVAVGELRPPPTLSTTTNGLALAAELFYTELPHPAAVLGAVVTVHDALAHGLPWLTARSAVPSLL